MAFEINLLTRKENIPQSVLKISRILKQISLILLLIFVITSVGLIVVRIYIAVDSQARSEKIKLDKEKIGKLKTTESAYLAFIQKISALDTLLNERFFPSTIIKKINEIVPPQAKIISTRLSPSVQDVDFSIDFDNMETVDSVAKDLENQQNPALEEIMLNSVEKDLKTNNYTAFFDISFILVQASQSGEVQ